MEKMTVTKKVTIDASTDEVWKALTTPALVKQYLFGTDVKSDWKKGSPIIYSGNWQGKDYQDKGTILDTQPGKLLKHTHWSSLSGTADIPENYYTVTYSLEPAGEQTNLTLTQEGLMTKEAAEHSGKNWEAVLSKLKEVVE
jgi:uncharacterized protein YndB with AHSA1/START domain